MANTLLSSMASVCVCTLVGCADLQSAVDPSTATTFEVSLSRGPCFGTCPVFDVTVDQAGQVVYEGHDFVAQDGSQTKSVPVADARAVLDALAQVDFWNLQESYVTEEDGCPLLATDMARSVWTVVLDGQTKTVTHDRGCRGLPEVDALDALEPLVEDKTGITEWIGK